MSTETAVHQSVAEHPAPALTTVAHRLWRVGQVAVASVSALAVLAVVALALSLTALPWAVHGHTLTVLSGSMRPLLPVGSVLVDRPTPVNALQIGEVITYATTDPGNGRRVLVTHRIAAIASTPTGRVFTTKGDANRTVDSRPVLARQVMGTLWFDVPYLGLVRSFLLNGAGLVMLGSGTTLLLAIALLRRTLRSHAEVSEPEPDLQPTVDSQLTAPAQADAPELGTASHH